MPVPIPLPAKEPPSVSITPLREADLAEAKRIFHLAFGTFVGLPDPMQFAADRDYINTRFKADPASAFAAHVGSQFVGSNFVARWGSLGVLGPLTVHPDFWNRGVASRLLEAGVQLFDRWGIKHAGLFTFPHSTKHISLYQKFGFWPRFLTAVMFKDIKPREQDQAVAKFSALRADQQAECLKACREVTDANYSGLDLESEIRAVASQRLGETILLWDRSNLDGLAICHCGAGTEAGSGTCYVKFATVRPDPRAAENFDRLLEACESLARQQRLTRVEAGVNLARRHAHQRLRDRGFETRILGVAMHRPDEPAYNRPNVYAIDDWR
jgi:GNAT superfamily N-acetyltransferase